MHVIKWTILVVTIGQDSLILLNSLLFSKLFERKDLSSVRIMIPLESIDRSPKLKNRVWGPSIISILFSSSVSENSLSIFLASLALFMFHLK